MKRDGRVEVRFLEPGFDGDRRRLENLGSVRPDHVDSGDPVCLAVKNELVERAFVAPGKNVLHRPEVGNIGANGAEAVSRFALGHSDTGDRRMAETGVGDAAIIDLMRLLPEEGIGECLAFPDCDWGQLYPVGHVADREDRGHACAIVGIDLELAAFADLYAGSLAAEILDIWPPAGGEKHRVSVEIVAPGHGELERSVIELF